MTVFRDLSQHILDIAENGLTAGANLLNIDIIEDTRTNQLTITVRDDGRGMSPDMVRRVTDPWVTTRTTRKVGLGIPFLKQTAEMCNGDFEIASTPGLGTTTSAAFQLDHIDRPPLGDVLGTLMCLVVGNPGVDVRYAHQVDDQEFSFDTRQIREILGPEIPFSDPEVLGYLRGALMDGIASVGGEAAASMTR
jgi:hypothetical protein